jgi:hypothetical protein
MQFENFLAGYQLCQQLEQCAATLTLFLLTLPRLRRRTIAAAVGTAAAATLSWGAGLAVWPVGMLALAAHRDRSRARLGAWAACTVLAGWIVRSAARGQFGPVPWHDLPAFALALLGKPWATSFNPRPLLVVAIGAAALAAFACLAVLAHRKLGQVSRQWTLYGILAVASSGLIALGRASNGLPQAMLSRYSTATYPLLIACVLLAVLLLRKVAEQRPRARRVLGATAVAIAIAAVAQAALVSWRTYPTIKGWMAVAHRIDLAIVAGTATDAEIQGASHPRPELVRRGVEVLRRYRLAAFRDAASSP